MRLKHVETYPMFNFENILHVIETNYKLKEIFLLAWKKYIDNYLLINNITLDYFVKTFNSHYSLLADGFIPYHEQNISNIVDIIHNYYPENICFGRLASNSDDEYYISRYEIIVESKSEILKLIVKGIKNFNLDLNNIKEDLMEELL